LVYTVSNCKDPNCLKCASDYAKCSVCKSTPVKYYLNEDEVCVTKAQVAVGSGVDEDNQLARTCASVMCLDCLNDYRVCVKCPPPINGRSFFMINGECSLCKEKPYMVINHECVKLCELDRCVMYLQKATFDPMRNRFIAKFDQEILFDKTRGTTFDMVSVDGKRTTLSKNDYDVSTDGQNLIINLKVKFSYFSGYAQFTRTDSDEIPLRHKTNSSIYVTTYPIEWNNMFLYESSTKENLQAMSYFFVAMEGISKLVSRYILVVYRKSLVTIPDSMIANVLYLKYLNGATYLYPGIILSYFTTDYMFPFISFGNPFKSFSATPECTTLPPRFEQNEIDCNMLYNWGGSLLLFLITLGINFAIYGLYLSLYGYKLNMLKQLKQKEDAENMENTRGHKIMLFMNTYYGVRWGLKKLDGSCLEVLFYSCLTLSAQAINSGPYFLGVVFSLIFCTYYIVSSGLLLSAIFQVSAKLEELKNRTEINNEEWDGDRPIKEVINFQQINRGFFLYQIEDFRADCTKPKLIFPQVTFLRNFVIMFLVLGGTNMKRAQFVYIGLIEASYLAYQIYAKPNTMPAQNYLGWYNSICQLVYFFFQIVGYSMKKVEDEEGIIGSFQMVLLLLFILVNLLAPFGAILWSTVLAKRWPKIVEKFRKCRKRRKVLPVKKTPINFANVDVNGREIEGEKEQLFGNRGVNNPAKRMGDSDFMPLRNRVGAKAELKADEDEEVNKSSTSSQNKRFARLRPPGAGAANPLRKFINENKLKDGDKKPKIDSDDDNDKFGETLDRPKKGALSQKLSQAGGKK
jgi:hypothetical protein